MFLTTGKGCCNDVSLSRRRVSGDGGDAFDDIGYRCNCIEATSRGYIDFYRFEKVMLVSQFICDEWIFIDSIESIGEGLCALSHLSLIFGGAI